MKFTNYTTVELTKSKAIQFRDSCLNQLIIHFTTCRQADNALFAEILKSSSTLRKSEIIYSNHNHKFLIAELNFIEINGSCVGHKNVVTKLMMNLKVNNSKQALKMNILMNKLDKTPDCQSKFQFDCDISDL